MGMQMAMIAEQNVCCSTDYTFNVWCVTLKFPGTFTLGVLSAGTPRSKFYPIKKIPASPQVYYVCAWRA